VTTRDEDVWDDARAEAFITELRRAWAAGELLEELPWSEVEDMDQVFDELGAQWALEDHAAAMVQRRRERRRRRAWGLKRDQG
jgi:hypothetical protein